MDSKRDVDALPRGSVSQEEGRVVDIGRKNAITEAESALRLHLRQTLRSRFQASPCKPHCWFYYGFEDFILREGRFFTPCPGSADSRGVATEEPFFNSLANAAAKQLPYVEGYAVQETPSIPVLHAWNSDDDFFAVDTTWNPTGVAYFGVVIPHGRAFEASYREGTSSVINNWRQHWPLLQRPWSKTVSEFCWPI